MLDPKTIRLGANLKQNKIVVKSANSDKFQPVELYAAFINGTELKIATTTNVRTTPTTWHDSGQLFDPSIDCAIEFNGVWERNPVTKKFYFISEELPWMFWVTTTNELYVRQWNDTPLLLATGVDRCASIRGWLPAQRGHEDDQGLIVAYLKSGVAYYRAFCEQPNGVSFIWEEERQISTLPTGLTDIALFRTNDFRVGVIGRTASGQAHVTVTTRNYTGTSLFPESLRASVSGEIEFKPIVSNTGFDNENVSAFVEASCLAYCHISEPYPVIVSTKRVGADVIKIGFNMEIVKEPPNLKNYFSCTFVHGGEGVSLSSATVGSGSENNTIILLLSSAIDESRDIKVNYDGWSDVSAKSSVACIRCLEPFEVIARGGSNGHNEEFILANISGEIELKEIAKLSGYSNELVEATVTGELSLLNIYTDPI